MKTDPDAPSDLAGLRKQAFLRGLKGQCPRCCSPTIYRSTYRLHERCPICGLPLEMEDGWSYGSVPLAYALACLFWVLPVALLFVIGLLGLKLAIALALAGGLLLPILTFRFTKSLWVGLYYAILPQEMRLRGDEDSGDVH